VTVRGDVEAIGAHYGYSRTHITSYLVTLKRLKRENLNRPSKIDGEFIRYPSNAHNDGDQKVGRVVATIKLFPEDVIIGVDHIKQEIERELPTDITIHKLVEEPIAFGLVALIAHLVIPEEEGRLETVESILQQIEGVGQIEVQLVRRV
jgi:translation elongation factor aEF-1 beta